MKKLYTCLLSIMIGLPVFAQNPQGFFLDDFQPKSIESPAFEETDKPTTSKTATVEVPNKGSRSCRA